MKKTTSLALAVVLLFTVCCTTSSKEGETVKKLDRNIFYFNPKNGNYVAVHFLPSEELLVTDSTFRILIVNSLDTSNVDVYSGEIQDTTVFIDWRDYSVDTISQFEPAMGGSPDFKYNIRRKLEQKGNEVTKYPSYSEFTKERLLGYTQIDSNTFNNALKKILETQVFTLPKDYHIVNEQYAVFSAQFHQQIKITWDELLKRVPDNSTISKKPILPFLFNATVDQNGYFRNIKLAHDFKDDYKLAPLIIKSIKEKKGKVYTVFNQPVSTNIKLLVAIK